MNLILLLDNDFINQDTVLLKDKRFEHIKTVLKANVNDILMIGRLNGLIGTGRITSIDEQQAILSTQLTLAPPKALPVTLIIALPRPKMIKRILQTCATMGVKKIIFINSFRVEKSYWQTPLLSKENIQEQLILGLQQAKDTILPEVILEKRFKPFVEDKLPNIIKDTTALVAHPNTSTPCPTSVTTETTLIVGPEGGFIAYEIEKLKEAGCQTIDLGQRILRVETAIPVLLAKFF